MRRQGSLTVAEQDAYRDRWVAHHPVNPTQQETFARRVATGAPGRNDLTTWAGLIAVEEGIH